MSLNGTLKDFGISDIFQLISHQSKTGVLRLRSGEEEVRISFHSGNVVRAESSTRKKKDLLGAMLVRAEAISEAQLEEALEIQRRTLRRLGDILVDRGYLSLEDLKHFSHLQTTETLYKLFAWEKGTYAFEPEEVVYDKGIVDPISSENILMEGFRMIDEWPLIRKKIFSYELVFKKMKDLPGADTDQEGKKAKRSKEIGRSEEKVLALVDEERTVQKLIDLSRLGEFETCKALLNLLNEGFIKTLRAEAAKGSTEKPGGEIKRFHFGRLLIQVGMYLFIAGVLLLVVRMVDGDLPLLSGKSGSIRLQDPLMRQVVDQSQNKRLRAALEIYRLEKGRYPDALEELVKAGLVGESDLTFPWRSAHVYQRRPDGYLLLRPLE